MSKQTKKSLVKNAAILSFGGLFCRLLGALYRIPLYSLIDEDGLGLYAMGYDIYALLLAVAAAGIPIAISKLVSEEISKNRMGEANRIFKIATMLITVLGLVITLGLILTAPLIARFQKDPRAVYTLVAVAPAIFLVSIMGGFKGYFQGLQRMWPTAISQMLEQIVRIVTILGLAAYTVSIGTKVEITAAAASFGATAGSLIGLLVVLVFFFKYKPDIKKLIKKYPATSNRTTKQLIKRILIFSIPITIGAMGVRLMSTIDTLVATRRLHAIGFANPTMILGRLKAVTPLINLPATLAYALAASLVPIISAAKTQGKHGVIKSRSSLSIKLILIIGFASAAGLHLLASPILQMLYKKTTSAAVLEILAFSVVFLTLQQACTGILQGLGKTKIPVINLFIGGIIKLVLNYVLIAIPSININGAAFSSIVAYGVASLLNVRAVCKYADIKIEWSHMIIKPLLATGLMSLVVSFTYNSIVKISLGNMIATLASVTIGVLSFGLALLVTKCFSEKELKLIPYLGPPITNVAGRLNLLRKE